MTFDKDLKYLLIQAYFFQGITEGAKGPTLLDLTDLYSTSVEEISYSFMVFSTGSVVGSFFSKLCNLFKLESHFTSFLFSFSRMGDGYAILRYARYVRYA